MAAGKETHPRLAEEIPNNEVEDVGVRDIKEGDAFVDDGKISWVAISDAEVRGGEVFLEVQYRDGGIDSRLWNDTGYSLPVLAAAE